MIFVSDQVSIEKRFWLIGAARQRGKKRGTFRSTTLKTAVFLVSGSSSVVEHRLAKARVASSNLVSRSTKSDEGGRMKFVLLHLSAFVLYALRYGGVAKW